MCDNKILTIEEVAEALRCSAWSVNRLIRNGELKAKKIGRFYRVPYVNLISYMLSDKED